MKDPTNPQSSPSATTKTLEDLIFSQRYPIKNEHLKDCAFVWLDEGQCKCKTEIPKALAAINSYTTQRVIEELESLTGHANEIPEHVIKYRIDQLKGGIDERSG